MNQLAISLLTAVLFSLCHSLQWYNITRPYLRGALCNDFSPAGYFLRTNATSRNWIIFLEGGGGCNTPSKCNERFIDSRIRKQFTSVSPNGSISVDVVAAWKTTRDDGSTVTSPLMTSLWRYASSIPWVIEGRDLLSTDRVSNPSFYYYNHVLIPYCSSDVWLRATNDYALAMNPSFKFVFDPLAVGHQFTFRGAAIYRSVILDLINDHGLLDANEVVLAGSSAGGLGAMNHAQWTQEMLSPGGTTLSVITDSAWFINFQDAINEQFSPDDLMTEEEEEGNSTCYNLENPSQCISAPLVLTDPNAYPDIPTFVLFSQYDLYLLTLSLQDALINGGGGGIIELMRIVSEYSGSMVTSRRYASLHFGNLSYYISSCFHHVYLATSDLWGDADAILGDESVDESYGNNRFVHKVQSNVWNTFRLIQSSPDQPGGVTIAQAIEEWLQVRYTGDVVSYTDGCKGPRCNPQCPEKIVLGQLGQAWSPEIQIAVSTTVVCITVVSVLAKLVFNLWYKVLQKRQRIVIECDSVDPNRGLESNLPYCDEEDAISVACLNLRYSVTLNKSSLNKSSMNPNVYEAQRYKRMMSVSVALKDEGQLGESRTRARQRNEVNIEMDQKEVDTSAEGNAMLDSLHEFQKRYQQKQSSRERSASLFRNKERKKKDIIRGISAYFNPGEMIAIMGPSGCGKTTFIDLLAGRQNLGSYEGEIFVNGILIDSVRDWYVSNTGYVLQLATPYYDSLTVRENLTLAAQMRLPKSYSFDEKLKRVEQILRETGLHSLADTVVGSSVGPGLSGGQKRRLCVALQLLNIPSLIFLDEPTSGLDSSSSLELLTHLNNIAASNRTVILTIHQPRLEIYHMFSQIILLCQGQIAYHGIPDNAYQFFVTAHLNATLNMEKISNMESKNPADMIMDMLGSQESRMAILKHYRNTEESQKIKQAVKECQLGLSETQGYSHRRKSQRTSRFDQMAALEARAKKMSSLGHTLYLPTIFLLYGVLLGTVFLQTQSATFILTGFGVYSCASGLFMFPAIYYYLYQAMQIFILEYSDGIGHTWQLTLQTFIRFASLTAFPVTAGASVAYLLIIPYAQYNFVVYAQTLVFNLALNQSWIALLMFVITAVPNYAHRISPVLSAIAGFAGGFFIPPSQMPEWYSWLFFVNPNYYGFSALIRVVLANLTLECAYESSLECYPTTGEYLLSYFSLHQVNPMLHVLLLLVMTGVLLILSWIALSVRHSLSKISSLLKNFRKRDSHQAIKSNSSRVEITDDSTITKEEEKDSLKGTPEHSRIGHISDDTIAPVISSSSMLQEGQTHEVWLPGKRTSLRSNKVNLEMRRRSLLHRVSSLKLPAPANQTTITTGKKLRRRLPDDVMLELRMKQWSKIEDGNSDLPPTLASTPCSAPIASSSFVFPNISNESSAAPLNTCSNNNNERAPCPKRMSSDVSFAIYSINEEEEAEETAFTTAGGEDVKGDCSLGSSKCSQIYSTKCTNFETSLDKLRSPLNSLVTYNEEDDLETDV